MSLVIVAYTINRNPHTKCLKIFVKSDSTVVVSAPMRISKKHIHAFVIAQQSWVIGQIEKLKVAVSTWEKPQGVIQDSYQSCKGRSLKFVRGRLHYYNMYYKFIYNQISVKKMSSRWSSCSSKRNISFHYRLLFLPLKLSDYVIVHELCHIAELNHSKRFWQLVRKTIPDYIERKKLLNKYNI